MNSNIDPAEHARAVVAAYMDGHEGGREDMRTGLNDLPDLPDLDDVVVFVDPHGWWRDSDTRSNLVARLTALGLDGEAIVRGVEVSDG